jgi:hypothetical protein
MKTKLQTLVSLAPLPFLLASIAQAEVLQNFDGQASARYVQGLPAETGNFDADADNEGKVKAEGFKVAFRIKFDRATALEQLKSLPILTAKALAASGENSAKFINITVVIQTDMPGQELFEPSAATSAPIRKRDVVEPIRIDLRKVATKTYPSLEAALTEFQGGKGQKFSIAIVQQTPKGETSSVSWDDIELVADAAQP